MPRLLLVSSLFLLLPSCLLVNEQAQPSAGFGLVAASQYNFRGMVNNEKGVVQADMTVSLPTAWENGQLTFGVWSNFDLSSDVGDAWFPEGHAGEPSEIDFLLQYDETYRGFDVQSGIISYALQNPDDFPFAAERGETKEFFLQLGRALPLELYSLLRFNYDFDEVDGLYVNGAVSREFSINDKLTASGEIGLAYSDDSSSEWVYGLEESGLADLRLKAATNYLYDAHTTLEASLNYATILDDDLSDWFDQIGIESDNFWITLGARWGY